MSGDYSDLTRELEAGVAKASWLQFVRRAYDVPDIVSDESALEHVAFLLARVVVDGDHPENTGEIPKQFLEALLEAGVRGALDGYLVELPRFQRSEVALDLCRKSGARLDVVEQMLGDVVEHLVARARILE